MHCSAIGENPNLRLRSRIEVWSRSWHGWFLEQSFLVRNLFYNDTVVDVLFRGRNGDRKSSRCLPNTSTFVPNDRWLWAHKLRHELITSVAWHDNQRICLIKDGHLRQERGKKTWDFQRICTGFVAPRGQRLGERQRRTAWWARHSKDTANDHLVQTCLY